MIELSEPQRLALEVLDNREHARRWVPTWAHSTRTVDGKPYLDRINWRAAWSLAEMGLAQITISESHSYQVKITPAGCAELAAQPAREATA